MLFRSKIIKEQPRQFYYLVPRNLTEKVLPLLPTWAGLAQPSENGVTIEVVKVSQINRESRKLSIKECVKLARKMVCHTMGYAQSCATHYSRFQDKDDQIYIGWVDPKVGTYEI